MTQGRCGSLGLHRTTLSFATPRRFIPAHLRASFRPRLAASVISPLRFAITSRPSRCEEDLHLLAVGHARHTKKKRRSQDLRFSSKATWNFRLSTQFEFNCPAICNRVHYITLRYNASLSTKPVKAVTEDVPKWATKKSHPKLQTALTGAEANG